MIKKKQFSSTNTLFNAPKKRFISKTKIQWLILIVLTAIIPFAIWSNIFAYEYNYIRCEGRPFEITGRFFKAPSDEGYGIHPGSDYSKCLYEKPAGLQRDPSTKLGAAELQKQADEASRVKNLASAYKIYIPNGYKISELHASDLGDRMETTYTITTNSNHKYHVREMQKDSDFSYTNLCSKPAEGSWSGTIIGKDNKGREICRTNLSKYIQDYIVGVNIENTAVMLQTPIDNADVLNNEATAIFNAMKVYSKSVADILR